MSRVPLAAAGLLTSALLVTGCAANPVQRAGGVTAMVAETREDLAMDAAIAGTLTITDTGCVAVASGDETYPLQFPHGTRLSDDGTEIHVPGLEPLRVGDEISGGGGYLQLTDVDEACVADNEHGEYAVWQTVGG